MTNKEKNERIKAVEEEMAKLQKELEDIRKEKTSEWDFSEWNNKRTKHLIDCEGLIDYVATDLPHDISDSLVDSAINKFEFIMKLFKFKYCYDRDYEPDWGNADELKHYVYFHAPTRKYTVSWATTWDRLSMVHFSSEEIAQKCADWLNAGCPGYLEEVDSVD